MRRAQGMLRLMTVVLASWILGSCLSPASGQFDDESATITTKDFGSGPLRVIYYCERGGGDAVGYFHVDVATTSGLSPRQRDLEIIFYVHSIEWSPQTSVAYHLPVRLPEGAASTQAAFPFFIVNSIDRFNNDAPMYWDVSVREDGRDIELARTRHTPSGGVALRMPRQAWSSTPFHMGKPVNSVQNVLRLIDGVAPLELQRQRARLLSAMGANAEGMPFAKPSSSELTFGFAQDVPKSMTIHQVSAVPDQWQYFLQFRIVVIDQAAWDTLRNSRPSVAEAIKTYVAAGGNFLLLGDERLDGQAAVEQWLLGGQATKTIKPAPAAGWQRIHARTTAWWLRDTSKVSVSSTQAWSGAMITSPQRSLRGGGPLSLSGGALDALLAVETLAEIKLRSPLDVGQELAAALLSPEDPLASGMVEADLFSSALDWSARIQDAVAWLETQVMMLDDARRGGCAVRDHVLGHVAIVEPGLTAVPYEQLQALLAQLGYSASIGANSSFDEAWSWRNMIPSVGRPPVWMFCGIVLLFGLVLGPGLLILTGWMRRRSLMIFLVPSISLVATLLIVGYEVFHEGFGTKIRVSSVLAVDERSKAAFAWSRQTYFSGWPSGAGLKFPSSAYFRPVPPEPHDQERRRIEPRSGVQSHIAVGASESVWTGWLRSRQQQQVLVGHPLEMAAPLKVLRCDRKSMQLKNTSQHRLPFALVRDGGEGYYLATGLEPGAEAECSRQTKADVQGSLTRLRINYVPAVPEGLLGGRGRGRGRVPTLGFNGASGTEVIDYAWNRYFSDKLAMPEFGFATILPAASGVIAPIEGELSASSHLVVGRLAW